MLILMWQKFCPEPKTWFYKPLLGTKAGDYRLEFVSPSGAGPYPRQKIRSSGAPMKLTVARVGVAPTWTARGMIYTSDFLRLRKKSTESSWVS